MSHVGIRENILATERQSKCKDLKQGCVPDMLGEQGEGQ